MPITSGVYYTDFNPLKAPPTKICTKCGQEKKRKEFKTKTSTKDGKDVMCSPCRDETNRKTASKRKEEKRKDDKYFV